MVISPMKDAKTKDDAWLNLALHPHKHFSRSICEDKFPNQWKRWIRCKQNACWMLRNIPASPLSNNQKEELKAICQGNPSDNV